MRSTPIAALALLFIASPVLSAEYMEEAEMARIGALISSTYQEGEQLYRDTRYAEAREKLRENFAFEDSVRQIEETGSELEEFKKGGAWYDYLNSWLYAGRASVELGDLTDALLCYSIVQKRVPLWTQIYREIEDVHFSRSDVDAQIATWELCITSFTNSGEPGCPQLPWVPAEAYERIGTLSLARGDYARTIQCGEKATGIVDEARVVPIMDAGLASFLTGDAQKAMRFYACAVEDAAPANRDSFGRYLPYLKAMCAAPAGSDTEAVSLFIFWALAEASGDTAAADELARQAASDPRIAERVQAVAAAAQLDTGCSYSVARFLSVTRNAQAAVT